MPISLSRARALYLGDTILLLLLVFYVNMVNISRLLFCYKYFPPMSKRHASNQINKQNSKDKTLEKLKPQIIKLGAARLLSTIILVSSASCLFFCFAISHSFRAAGHRIFQLSNLISSWPLPGDYYEMTNLIKKRIF